MHAEHEVHLLLDQLTKHIASGDATRASVRETMLIITALTQAHHMPLEPAPTPVWHGDTMRVGPSEAALLALSRVVP